MLLRGDGSEELKTRSYRQMNRRHCRRRCRRRCRRDDEFDAGKDGDVSFKTASNSLVKRRRKIEQRIEVGSCEF